VGDKAGYSTVMTNYAGILLDHGDLPGAQKMYYESLGVAREIGDKSGEGVALVNIADIVGKQGDFSDANQNYGQALAIFRASGDQSSVAYPLMGMGNILMDEGDLPAAQQKYSEALKLRQKVGEQATAAHTQLALAELSLEQARPAAQEEASVRQLLDGFRNKDDVEGQIDAGILLSRILLEEHETGEAQKQIAAARQAAKTNQNLERNLRMEITTARVESSLGNFDRASRVVSQVVARAKQSGYLALQFEAQLALAQAQIASGKISEGKVTLAEVRSHARGKGYGLIASKASRSLAAISH
jgi:predicted negative regulator of RcsB-dependent stress response